MIPLRRGWKVPLAGNVEHCTLSLALGLVALPRLGGENYWFLAAPSGAALFFLQIRVLMRDIRDFLTCTLEITHYFTFM
jgi:hypothetical protein